MDKWEDDNMMSKEAKVQFSSKVKIFSKNKKSLVANISAGDCLFLSDEIVDIFKRAEMEKLSFGELYECVEDSKSRELLISVSEKLDALKMWKHNEVELNAIRRNSISFLITNNCNLRCRHCGVSAGDNLRGRELSTEEIFTVIDRMMLFNPADITISGGEPMVRKDFFEITEKLRSVYSGNLSLMTNGMFIKNDEIAAYLAEKYDSFSLSIDGYDEESCAAIRGKGVFDKVINAVKALHKYTDRISLSMVMTSDNEKYTDLFEKLCESLGVISIIRTFDPIGRGKDLYDKITVDRENDPSAINWNSVEEKFKSRKIYKHKPQIFACKGGTYEFQIDQKGDVYPCPLFMEEEFKLFNILDIANPKEFIASKKYSESKGYYNFSRYLPENIPMCSKCEKQLMCFTCAAEIKKMMINGKLERRCAEYNNYFDMYWRDYERI